MALTFAVPDAATAALLRLVASYGGLDKQLDITTGDVSDVKFPAYGAQAFGVHTACRFLASSSPAAAQLLGESADQQAKVAAFRLGNPVALC